MDDLEVTGADYRNSSEGDTESTLCQNNDVVGRDRSLKDSGNDSNAHVDWMLSNKGAAVDVVAPDLRAATVYGLQTDVGT